ncbi:MAG: 4'-phosphopantetheinyl transferase superfamily protein [Eubacterium sp.]|nr:4'-phosphopantetheinyl transferase superfamily protein [Eubacterium sp.]
MREQIYLYKLDIETMKREEPRLLGLLPKWRYDKAIKYKIQRVRYESIGAGRLLDIGIAGFFGINEGGLDWSRQKIRGLGKDENKGNFYYEHEGVRAYYNISHSGDYVAVAVALKPCGIDIEFKDDKDFKISQRMFNKEDQCYICPDGDSLEAQDRFRDVWTIKESYVKCLGKGLSIPLKSFTSDYDVLRQGGAPAILVKTDGFNDNIKKPEASDSGVNKGIQESLDIIRTDFHTRTMRLNCNDKDYSLTLCMEKDEPKINLIRIEKL